MYRQGWKRVSSYLHLTVWGRRRPPKIEVVIWGKHSAPRTKAPSTLAANDPTDLPPACMQSLVTNVVLVTKRIITGGMLSLKVKMQRMNTRVSAVLDRTEKWREEFERLRAIVLDCGLMEELKWGVPCYTFQGRNIVLIHGFKDYCALLFFKGVLLKDPKGILIQQTKNVQAARQIRFRSAKEIGAQESILKAYIHDAIEVEKTGLEVRFKNTSEFRIPEEFRKKMKEIPALNTAFGALTPGRQRAYIFYFSQPKQSKTRESRVEKFTSQILNGKGLND